MEKGVASILLVMLSLQALLLAAAAVAGGSSGEDDMGSLTRLPSDSDDDTAAASGKRPWKCCDSQGCTRSLPPICWCTDQLKQCSNACKECSKVKSNPPRYICEDVYRGEPAPRCHHKDLGEQVAAVSGAEEIMAVVR